MKPVRDQVRPLVQHHVWDRVWKARSLSPGQIREIEQTHLELCEQHMPVAHLRMEVYNVVQILNATGFGVSFLPGKGFP